MKQKKFSSFLNEKMTISSIFSFCSRCLQNVFSQAMIICIKSKELLALLGIEPTPSRYQRFVRNDSRTVPLHLIRLTQTSALAKIPTQAVNVFLASLNCILEAFTTRYQV